MHQRPWSTILVFFLAAMALSRRADAVTAPYTIDFESAPLCAKTCGSTCPLTLLGWTNDATDDQDWLPNQGATPTLGTGPSVDRSPGTAAGTYLLVETSGAGCDDTAFEANPISPPLTLTGLTAPRADFWFHQLGVQTGPLAGAPF